MKFMWALLLYLGFDCCWPISWWVLASGWLAESLNHHHILYAVVHVLIEQNKTTQ